MNTHPYRTIAILALALSQGGSSGMAAYANADAALVARLLIQTTPTIMAISVNTLEDELNSDGDCSLREAITAANDNTAIDVCPAGNGVITDTINFAVAGTIQLAAQLGITAGGPLAIDSGGAITLSGENSVRVFYVSSGSDLALESLTITKGSAENGGGIYNAGALTVSDSTLSGNGAQNNGGGVYNLGLLTVSDSTLSGNGAYYGGGIYNQGVLTITNSTLSGNFVTGVNWPASRGGGIYNYSGTISLANSTLVNDRAPTGGGIYNESGILTIMNSTLYGNQANYDGGGIYITGGTLDIMSSTLSGNSASDFGGGIEALGGFRMRNTILANNSSTYYGPDCEGEVVSMGYNLVGDKGDCYFVPTTGDLTGVDPKLGPLQDNGGSTHTQALLPDSLAINAGNLDGCTDHLGNPLTSDQRGFARSGRCDIGAYEWRPEISGPYVVYLPCVSSSCPTKSFSDDFGNSNSGWPILANQNAQYEYLNSEYRILVKSAHWWAGARPGFKASDFVAVVDVRNATGVNGSYGLLFGLSDDWKQFYTFGIDPGGGYAIWRTDSNNWTLLAAGLSGSIHPGTATNQLKIERTGGQIWACANGQLLNIISDGNYTGLRHAGLIAISYAQPNVDVRFDNLTLYPITCGASSVSPRKEDGTSEVQGMEAEKIHSDGAFAAPIPKDLYWQLQRRN